MLDRVTWLRGPAFARVGWLVGLLLLAGVFRPSSSRGEADLPDLVPPVALGEIALDKDRPFRATSHAPAEARAGETVRLRFTVHLLNADHYLYKEMMKVELKPVEGLSFGKVQFSRAPIAKFDPFEERDREVYKKTVTMFVDASVAAEATAGPRSVAAIVKYQGCNPTTCFMPAKEPHNLSLRVVGARGAALVPPSAASGDGDATTRSSEAGAGSDGQVTLEDAAGDDDAPVSVSGGVPHALEALAPADAAPAAPPASSPTRPGGGVPDARTVSPTGTDTLLSGVGSDSGFLRSLFGSGLAGTFLGVFILGIFASLTPCIYPIIPITVSVLGARDARSRFHGFALALVYVLGLSLTYTILGVLAASTEMIFGAIMQNDWVVGGIAALFIAMGFGMLGAFNVALPSGITTRLATIQGRGMPGAFLTGTIAGLVASPCVGPLIVSLLAYIAQTGDILLGSALMFTFAFGMGQLFLLLGTFAVSLPRSGEWMDLVKGSLALMLFGVGLFYLQTVIPGGYYELLIGTAVVLSATFVGAFLRVGEEAPVILKVRKGLGLLMLIVGVYAFVGGLLGTGLIAPQVGLALRSPPGDSRLAPTAAARISWGSDLDAALARAAQQGAPILVDFTADWCGACKELEHYTFSDPRVIEAASVFESVRVDATDSTPEFDALKARFGIRGLPYVLFLSPEGEPIAPLTVTGFVPADDFLKRLCQVPAPATQRIRNVCQS